MKRHGIGCAVALLAGLTAALTTSAARAQNADPFFFGDEAALGAGAVVASGRDSGALWYNPAGFGGLQRGLVSASASTFGVRIRNVQRALRVRVGGQERAVDLSSSDVISVPNAIVAAAKIGDRYAIAGGLLTTQRDIRSALVIAPEAPGTTVAGENVNLGQRIDLQSDFAKYHFGGAFAAALSNELRLGFAVFATYTKATDNVQYALSANSGPNVADEHGFIAQSARVTRSAVGVAGSIGLQWQASPLVALGLSIRTPEVALTASTEGGVTSATANAGGTTTPPSATFEQANAPDLSAGGKVLTPARLLGGVAFALGPPQSWVELGFDVAHGLPGSALVSSLVPTVNGRVGARYMLSRSWIVGGGVFSDRSSLRNLGSLIASDRVDYYGLTLGVSKRTPLALVKDPSPEALVLVTTLSLRTSVGFGEARALTIDVDQPKVPRDDRSDVTFYEIMPYLGSAVVF